MSESETLQGIIVRRERHGAIFMFIIWTQEVNLVYIRQENFDQSQFTRGDLVYVDVRKQRFSQYCYEGRNCQKAHANTWSPDWKQFSPCTVPNNLRRETVMWKGDFEMVTYRDFFIQSVSTTSSEPSFVRGVRITDLQQESMLRSGNRYFEACVILDYSTDHDNKHPWTLHSLIVEAAEKPMKTGNKVVKEEPRVEDFDEPLISTVNRGSAYLSSTIETLEKKQRRQLNAGLIASGFLQKGSSISMPSPTITMYTSQLYGFCLFSDFSHLLFYCSTDGVSEESFGCPLKLSLKLSLQVGSWYRIMYKGPEKLSAMNSDSVISAEYFLSVMECEEPYKELISRVLPNSSFVNKIYLRAYVQFHPEFKFFAKHLDTLWDNNDVMKETVTEYLNTYSSVNVCFIVEVTPDMEFGFVVTRCHGIDEGRQLTDYLLQDRLNYVSLDDIQRGKEKSVPDKENIPLDQHLPGKKDTGELEQRTESVSAVLSPSVVSNVFRKLLTNNLKNIVHEEGLSSELDNMIYAVAGSSKGTVDYQQPDTSTELNEGPGKSKMCCEPTVSAINASTRGISEAHSLRNVLVGLFLIKNVIKEAGEIEAMHQLMGCMKLN